MAVCAPLPWLCGVILQEKSKGVEKGFAIIISTTVPGPHESWG